MVKNFLDADNEDDAWPSVDVSVQEHSNDKDEVLFCFLIFIDAFKRFVGYNVKRSYA